MHQANLLTANNGNSQPLPGSPEYEALKAKLTALENPPAESTPAKTPKVKPESKPRQMDFLAGMADALTPYLEAQLQTKLDEDQVSALIEARVKTALDNHTRTIKIENVTTGEVRKLDITHANFADLLALVQMRLNVYMFGDAGSGKTKAAEQVAEALGLPFYAIALNQQSPAYLLTGFIAADGKTFTEPDFYKAYRDGGVFLIDELDAANGNLLTALNTALINGFAMFPCGRVARHKDFVCVATGNTTGRGASQVYNARQPLDGATLERFVFLEWGYDEKLESTLALNENPDARKWVSFVQSLRKYCKQHHPKVLVTPRASIFGAQLLRKFKPAQVADMVIFKGLDADTKAKIVAANPIA